MKWTALWSLMLAGAILTGCGGDSGGGGDSASSDHAPAAPVSDISSSDSCAPLNSYFSELRDLTNAARTEVKAPPLSFSLQLGQSAQQFAKDMATKNYFSYNHIGKNGSTFDQRIEATGYSGTKVGENLAAGGYSAQQTFNDWMDSPTHQNNLLSSAFTEVGFGMFESQNSDFGRYWVQHLGNGSSAGGVHIPSDCGLGSMATASKVPTAAVAGRSNLDTPSRANRQAAQPGTAYGGEGLTLPGNGTIPAGSLAFAIADSTRRGENREIPEPTLLLGLGGIGLALWRDRKVAARKASALATDTRDDSDSAYRS